MRIHFDMIGIFVQDMRKMVAFYQDVLGLYTAWDGKSPHAEFDHEGIRFSMYERAKLPTLFGCEPSYPQGLNGTFELALDFPCADDVDREFARIVEAGATPIYAPREEPWGMYSSAVMDPEGNVLELGSWRKGLPQPCDLQVITVSVSNIEKSKYFYETILGFKVGTYYEPTRWMSFKYNQKAFFAIMETPGLQRPVSNDSVDFFVEDVEGLWAEVRERVTVINELTKTPWGSYKFVIQDPDGYNLGFVQK